VFLTWVPPQNSIETALFSLSKISITLTFSPYLSSKKHKAPFLFASSFESS
jgi:hypothetical protein